MAGMDTSSVAGAPCSQAGSQTGGLTPLEAAIMDMARAYGFGSPESRAIVTALEHARAALAKAEATATEAQHAGQWVLVPREPTEAMIEVGASKRTTIQIGNQAMSGAIGEWAAKDAYRAMIDAAPPPPAAGQWQGIESAERRETVRRVLAGLEEMANRASTPMELWDRFSNDVIELCVDAEPSPAPLSSERSPQEPCPKCGGTHPGRYEGACAGPPTPTAPPPHRMQG